MSFSPSQDFISKIKHIIGYLLVLTTIATVFSGSVITTDKVDFKIEPGITTESTTITVEMTNKSLYGINSEVTIDKLEKKVGEEWEEIKLYDFINYFPLMYTLYPGDCILPFETGKSTRSFLYICNQDNLDAGDYRITLSYRAGRSSAHTSVACEFIVAQA